MPQPSPTPQRRPALEGEARKSPLWTCPFCPLLCDDIALNEADGSLRAINTDCPRLSEALIQAQANRRTPELDKTPIDLQTAIKKASDILQSARHPLFSSLTTDVSGARSLYELAAASNATLDHLHGDTLAASTFALQDRGALFTTLSEVRSRADLMIVFACTPTHRYPRFYERTLSPSREVKVIFVGCKPEATHEAILENHDPLDILSLWSALTEGQRDPKQLGEDATELATLNEHIRNAKYTALIYEPAALENKRAALAIEALHRIVKALNRTVRAGALALTGDDGALTVNQTVTWRSGFPLRTRVAYGMPLDHDAHRYGTETLIREGRIDALLWVSSFAPEPLPASLDDETPVIILGHAGTLLHARKGTTVFIPVATPGLDHDGHLFRIDASVVAPLTAARVSAYPSVATIVKELAERRRTA